MNEQKYCIKEKDTGVYIHSSDINLVNRENVECSETSFLLWKIEIRQCVKKLMEKKLLGMKKTICNYMNHICMDTEQYLLKTDCFYW